MNKTNYLSSAPITTIDPASLSDLRDIKVDPTKPVAERVKAFLDQVGDPSFFRVGDIKVKVNYGIGKTFTEALANLFQAG